MLGMAYNIVVVRDYIILKQNLKVNKMSANIIYKWVETLESSSENDIELFKHLLNDMLGEVNLTENQLQIMQDRADLIALDQEIKGLFSSK